MTTHELLLARHLLLPGERAALYSRVRRGELHPVIRGCWVSAATWAALDQPSRHRLVCLAADHVFHEEFIFSHRSAAGLWRLPLPGLWPDRAHVLTAPTSRGRSTAALIRHGRDPVDGWLIDDLMATSLEATVVDVAATEPFAYGVIAADAALRRSLHPVSGLPAVSVTKEVLEAEAARVSPSHGGARVRRVIEFADGAADRPGESLSRVSILRAGLPLPMLQVALRGASGREYFVDFFWPDSNVIGEFDGKAKYRDPAFLRGRIPEQALYDEKLREDDLRAVPHGFARWNWATAQTPTALGTLLRRAGVG